MHSPHLSPAPPRRSKPHATSGKTQPRTRRRSHAESDERSWHGRSNVQKAIHPVGFTLEIRRRCAFSLTTNRCCRPGIIELELRFQANAPLGIIATHCSQLQKLVVKKTLTPRNFAFSISGFSSLLQANVGLRELNVLSRCQLLRAKEEVIDVLNQHLPQLERINVAGCTWFTDECLERLVQGQIDYWSGRREGIPFLHIDAWFTPLSRAGVDLVLAKPNVGNLEVEFTDSDMRAAMVLSS